MTIPTTHLENNLPTKGVYTASPIKKRRRASKEEIATRRRFIFRYAEQHRPVNVRQLYYAAEVAEVPGIGKKDADYDKVQRLCLLMRREGELPYEWIADNTRWMRKPTSYDSVEDALYETARLYRKRLWSDNGIYLEVWLEKDALAGVILPVTQEYDVPLMVTRGYSSETFAYEAAQVMRSYGRECHIIYLGDFDRAGVDAGRSLREKLQRFAGDEIDLTFTWLGVTENQIKEWALPTRPPKRKTAADKKWPHPFACELDAIPPNDLRALVRGAIQQHMPDEEFEILKAAEQSEQEIMGRFVEMARLQAAE